jgi:hypothetical protein
MKAGFTTLVFSRISQSFCLNINTYYETSWNTLGLRVSKICIPKPRELFSLCGEVREVRKTLVWRCRLERQYLGQGNQYLQVLSIRLSLAKINNIDVP